MGDGRCPPPLSPTLWRSGALPSTHAFGKIDNLSYLIVRKGPRRWSRAPSRVIGGMGAQVCCLAQKRIKTILISDFNLQNHDFWFELKTSLNERKLNITNDVSWELKCMLYKYLNKQNKKRDKVHLVPNSLLSTNCMWANERHKYNKLNSK